MLSPKQAAQPNPSYPALCRQDTTSPWRAPTTEEHQELNSDTNASNETYLKKKTRKRKRRTFFQQERKKKKEKRKKKKEKRKKKKEKRKKKKHESEVTLKWAILNPLSLSTEAQKIEFSQKEKSSFFTVGTVRRFFFWFWRLLGRLKNEKKEKKKKKKTKMQKRGKKEKQEK